MFKSTDLLVVFLLLLNGYSSYSHRVSEKKCREYYSSKLATAPDNTPRKEFSLGKVSTVPGEFPYMAALGWKNKDGGYDFFCGGTLISPEFVLIAASCAQNKEGTPPDIVRVGGGSLSDSTESDIPVANINVHPQFESKKPSTADIGVLKLASPSSNQPACLWQTPEINQSEVTAIGYGTDSQRSPDLLKVNLEIYSKDDCSSQFKPLINEIADSQMCAGDHNGVKGTSRGDGGGPFLVSAKDGDKVIPYVAGVISFGRAGSFASAPTVATRVSSYLDYIEPIVWQ